MNTPVPSRPRPVWQPSTLALSVSLTPAQLGLLGLLIPGLTEEPATRRLTLSSVPRAGGPFVFPAPLSLTRLNLRLLDLSVGGYLTLGNRTFSETALLNACRQESWPFMAALHATLARQPHWAQLYAALARATSGLRHTPGQEPSATPVQLDCPVRLSANDTRLLSAAHQLPPGQYVLCAHWNGQALTRHEVYTQAGRRVPLHPDHLTPARRPPPTLPRPEQPSERIQFDVRHASRDHAQHAMSLHLLVRRALLRSYAAALQPAVPAPATAPTITRTAVTFTAVSA